MWVTGATGMVGRNIVERLLSSGYDVLSPTRSQLDLRDLDAVRSFLGREAPQVVVHAAGRVGGIVANMEDPVGFLVENVDLARNVIVEASRAGVAALLNVPSSCIYPRDAPNPLREEAILSGPLESTNEGYAIAKIYALRLCEYVNRMHPGVHYRSIVPCNLYGRYDHFEEKRGHLVAALIHRLHHAAARGDREQVMWGDGRARREFMYVGDLAQFVAAALLRLETLPITMNVGVGGDRSVGDYYEAVAKAVGYDGTFRPDPSKPTGMKQKLVDSSRVNAWGWRPTTGLPEGLAETYRHYLTLPQAAA
ncbi:MAG: GDP-L-fucose synthase family protein [Thermoplasmatota archaeon]